MKTFIRFVELLVDWSVFALGCTMVIEHIAPWQVFIGILLILSTLPSIIVHTLCVTKKLLKQKENKEG